MGECNINFYCTLKNDIARGACAEMGQYLKLPKGASPARGRFLKWVPLATRINRKKKTTCIYEKKRFSPKSSFLCRTILIICSVPKLPLCVFDNWLCHHAAIVIWYLMKFHKLICMVITVTANGQPLSWSQVARIGTKQNGVKARGGRGGGGTQVHRGAAPSLRISRKKGSFLRPPHVRDFVKEGYFFVPRYEVWGSKSPYNPRNIRGSDAE